MVIVMRVTCFMFVAKGRVRTRGDYYFLENLLRSGRGRGVLFPCIRSGSINPCFIVVCSDI